MKAVFSDRQLSHRPAHIVSSGAAVASPETPARAEILLAAALGLGLEREAPADYGLDPIRAVHTERYLRFLERIHERWLRIPDASTDVLPNVHPATRDAVYPASAVGQVGFHVFDGAAPITADTWDAALWSAWTAVHAAREVVAGAPACYALSRPPGHHAGKELAGGFCYLNNSAIAARELRGSYEKVAILDVDVHHGNGTQDIFYECDDVLTVSIHADPVRFYPFFWGAAGETGAGAGHGYNCNLPLPRGTGDDDYLATLGQALGRIADYAPGALVVALGLDASGDDPFAGFAITTQGFGRIGERIAGLRLPTVLVQEGGYPQPGLGDNLAAFLGAYGL